MSSGPLCSPVRQLEREESTKRRKSEQRDSIKPSGRKIEEGVANKYSHNTQ